MNAIATLRQGRKLLYLYPDGTMIPMIAGGDALDDWLAQQAAGDDDPSNAIIVTRSRNVLGQPSDYFDMNGQPIIWADIPRHQYVMDAGGFIYRPQATTSGGTAGQPGTATFRFNKLSQWETKALYGDGGVGSSYTGRDAAAQALDYAQIEDMKERTRIEREKLAAQAAEARQNTLTSLINQIRAERGQREQQWNELQPDAFRFAAGLSRQALKGSTPTQAWGSFLQSELAKPVPTLDLNADPATMDAQIATLQGQLNEPGAQMPAIGMAEGGTIDMGMHRDGSMMQGGMMGGIPSATMGNRKRAVMVGDKAINGDEEIVTVDPATGTIEVIPFVGRAAAGATIPGEVSWEPSTAFPTLSSLYPGYIDFPSANDPVAFSRLGYVPPVASPGEVSQAPLPAYGAMSEPYFVKLPDGRMIPLPNPGVGQQSRILRQLRVQNPYLYDTLMGAYETATDASGGRSGLSRFAIDAMLDAGNIRGREGAGLVGIR